MAKASAPRAGDRGQAEDMEEGTPRDAPETAGDETVPTPGEAFPPQGARDSRKGEF